MPLSGLYRRTRAAHAPKEEPAKEEAVEEAAAEGEGVGCARSESQATFHLLNLPSSYNNPRFKVKSPMRVAVATISAIGYTRTKP